MIDEGGGKQARQTGCHCVSRNQQTKLSKADAKQAGELRAQRHHDHEVHNVCELNASERQKKQ